MSKHVMRLALFAALTAGMLTLSGCWDIKDINHRALPILMGIKQMDQDYKVFLLVPEAGQNNMNLNVISETGDTINETLDDINKNTERKVDLLHLKVIVYERSFAENGLEESISSFMRSRDIPNKTFVAISDGELEPLFEKLKAASSRGGLEIYNYFEKNAGWTPDVVQTRIWEVYRSINSYTRDVVIPMIKPGRTTAVMSTGAAIIKNGKMVDSINSEEALLYNLFKGSGTQGKIEVMNQAAVKIVSDSLSQSSRLNGDQPVMNSRLHLKVTVLETKGSPSEAEIKQEINELLSMRFQKMLRTSQAKEADILGFGQYFRDKLSRDDLQRWRSAYYPRMKLNFRVHIVIQDEGLLKTKR